MGLPKCLIEVEGKTILSRLIESLEPHVPRIHVVIGYREELVAEYCARHHREVVLVRNPRFRDTNTAYSISLGSIGFHSKVLYLDGDLIIEKESLAEFLRAAAGVRALIGVTPAKSENAVLASISGQSPEDIAINAFGRELQSRYEWANVFSGPPVRLEDAGGFVYQALEPLLPLPARLLELHEVDTPGDLSAAEAFMKGLARSDA
ncbi:NTP transferase domain-containing protein [Stenotrophomonas sp.]|uniref:NTP transferase domain-containing protein n=1 Tax=Stenotrophomonas sp. TaxID=69392 RepID=UPI0028A66449|nr:NTP transferase domain-containing protein [Stenotrophomonas sp.]